MNTDNWPQCGICQRVGRFNDADWKVTTDRDKVQYVCNYHLRLMKTVSGRTIEAESLEWH